ncbi:hypothetical protein ACET3Z_014702 [Daucus carota]
MSDELSIRDSCKRLRDDEDMELVTIVVGFIVVVAAVSYGQMYRVKEVTWNECERAKIRATWMNTLTNDRMCREQLRLDIRRFEKLVHVIGGKVTVFASFDATVNSREVGRSVEVLKTAAKTRKVAAEEILSAFKILEKAKLDPSGFLDTLGGTESPGRTWMLIFTAEKQLNGGKYFPITAIQRFDAVGKRIENGVYLGPLGWLTFEGRLSWKKRILAFMFEHFRIKIGPFNPFDINIKGEDESEPSTKNPFFIWFYIDEEIAVARGRSGGTAFWCRCRRVEGY